MRTAFFITAAIVCVNAVVGAAAIDHVLEWHGGVLEGQVDGAFAATVEPNSTVRVNVLWENVMMAEGAYAAPCLVFESAVSDGRRKEMLSCIMGKRHPLEGVSDVREAEGYFTVPENAERLRLTFTFKGNSASVKVLKCDILKVAGIPKDRPQSYPVIKHEGAMLSDAQLDDALAKSDRLRPELRTEGDMVSLFVNGRRTAPKIYKTSSWCKDSDYDMLKTFQSSGFNIFTVTMSLGIGGVHGNIWTLDGKCDVDKVCAAVRKVLKRVPDAMVMIELRVTPPYGWSKANPDEVFQHSDGRKGVYKGSRIIGLSDTPPTESGRSPEFWHPSYYSMKFNDQAAEAIRDLFLKFESTPESKRVIGVYLNGGTDMQWLDMFDTSVDGIRLTADYSPAALKAFRKSLTLKYGNNVNALNAAWSGTTFKAFDEIGVPAADELWRKESMSQQHAGASKTSDYCEFLGYANAERHIKWCRAVKDSTARRLLTGGYCPCGGLSAFPLLSQQNSEWLISSNDIDFFAIVPGYKRDFCDPVMIPAFNGSMLLHGKLLIAELDLRNPEVGNWGMWGSEFWRRTHGPESFKSDVLRFVSSLTSQGGTFHAYDMEGGWFNTKNAMNAWRTGCGIYDQASPGPLTENRIAVVSSGRFWDFQSFGANDRFALYNLREFPKAALARSGVRFDYYLLTDVIGEARFAAPKVLMFTDVCDIRDADSIKARYGNSGRVLVWLGAPGVFSGDPHAPSKVSGFNLRRARGADGKPVYIKGNADPLVAGVEGFLISNADDFTLTFDQAWEVFDAEAKVLGEYFGTGVPGIAVKRHGGYTELYIGQPGAITPRLIRNIAVSAGIAPVADSNDIVGYGGKLLYLTALTSGRKTIRLPDGLRMIECLTGEETVWNGDMVEANVLRGRTMILKLGCGTDRN